MKIFTNVRTCALSILLIGIAGFVYGTTGDKTKKNEGEAVTLKNTAGQYLKMEQSSQGVVKPLFVSDQEDASVFTKQIVPESSNRVGVSQKYFIYKNRYLSGNLTLHVKPTPDCRWMAPVHYLYYNHFKSGTSQELIAEEIK